MKKISLLLCVISTWLGSHAQISLSGTTAETPLALKTGETYQFPTDFFSNAYFTYTATEDGLLTLTLSEPLQIFYSNLEGESGGTVPKTGNMFFKGMKSGEVCQFHSEVTWGKSITMTVSFEAGNPYLPVDTVAVTPSSGNVYHTASREGAISFEFNQPIIGEKITAWLIYGTEKISLNNYRLTSNFSTKGSIYTLYIADVYKTLQQEGKLNAGTKFSILLNNIYAEEGEGNVYPKDLTVSYIASEPAVEFVKASHTNIKSYYLPGNEEGLLKLTFTGEIICEADAATLFFGDKEAGTWNEIPVPYTLEGNNIILNLQGISLNTSVLGEYTTIGISLKGIKDKAGYYIQSNDIGNVGSITLNYTVEQVVVNIYTDFTPGKGKNIDDVTEVEIWVGDGKNLFFKGAELSYLQDGDSVTSVIEDEAIRRTADPDFPTDLLIYIPVSGYAFDAGEVTLRLTGTLAADGSSPTISCTYLSEGKYSSIPVIIQTESSSNKGIYNMEGKLLHPSYNETIWKALPSGIYLIGGRKIVK